MKLRENSGHGTLLVLVMALLMLLAIMVVAHGFFSSSVSRSNQYAAKGDVAIDLAANALTEAHQAIARKLNERASSLHREFRKNLDSFAFSLPLAELPFLSRELKKQKCFALVNGEVTAQVLGQVSTSNSLPTEWDRAGRLRLCASIVHLDTKVVRHLAQIYDFRISLPALPRPFDTHTLVIGDGNPLTNTYARANETIIKVNKRIEDLKDVVEKRKNDFEKAIKKLESDTEAQRAVDTLKVALLECRKLLNEWPKFDGPSLFPMGPFALTTDSGSIDLCSLDLPSLVRKRNSTIKSLEEQQSKSYENFCENLRECGNSSSEVAQVLVSLKNWCAYLKNLVTEYESLLVEDYKAFQERFEFLQGDERALFSSIFTSMDASDLVYRATAVLYDSDVHRSGDLRTLNQKFAQLLSRGPAFSGVLYVMNKDEELVINRTFKGQLLIIVEGDCVIQRALVEDKKRDTITIFNLGRVAIEGDIEGSVLANNTIIIDSAATIKGNLVITSPDFTNVSSDRVLSGKIIRDERLITGSKEADGTLKTVGLHRLYATLGPIPVGVEAERK